MNNPFSFELEDALWEETVQHLRERTDYDVDQLRRGLTFMVGRRVGALLQSLGEEETEGLLRELDIAILHSEEEK